MALDEYRRKRNFAATPEPKGAKARRDGASFVIQKHAARRLHYDLRLEMDGVLRSWAVARGPSLVPGEKRLAVHVEDHPLEYGTFEGTIPKGEYGGGSVIIWDRGTWRPVADARKGYAKGHLEFELKGEKLGGRWHLVRMAGKPREKRENWLLIKGEDKFARSETDPDILEERPESVASGRKVEDLAGEAPGWSSKTGRIATHPSPPGKSPARRTRPVPLPAFVEPALATLAPAPPSGPAWLHEIKFDGYRLQARIDGGTVSLLTRSGLDWTGRFGDAVPAALRSLPAKAALIDGEMVVENGQGATDFPALQADLSDGRTDRFVFYAFDLVHLDGTDLRRQPLSARKALLEKLVPGQGGKIRYSGHFDEAGDIVLRHACRLGLEGVVSKKRDAPYKSGRNRAWVKSKCSARQEFVIGGFVPSTVSGSAIGSLVLGVYEDGQLRHVGRVGTGYSAAVARSLFATLSELEVSERPFSGTLGPEATRGVRWVRPERVAEVEFRGWTGDGNLRHASFRALREDKAATDIVRERAFATGSEPQEPPMARRTVKLTHPERIYWPDAGITKEGLADYYTDIWRFIAPHVTGRPLALLRAPEGIAGQTFFQKHAWKGVHKSIRLLDDPAETGHEHLIGIDSLDGLVGLVQAGVLEIHPWGSTVADWERPDLLTTDLDPGEGVAWPEVIAAALDVKARLEAAGLAAFVKTSGGKGLHVVSPLEPRARWPEAKAFAKALAEAMARDQPDRYVATVAKAKRKGRILIDYLRNQRGATAVAAYSTRARPGAPVSVPLGWDELSADIGPAHFTVANVPARLSALAADPWADFRASARPLPKLAGLRKQGT